MRRRARFTWAVMRDSWHHFLRDDGLEIAGNMAFMIILSFFPFLIFVTALAGVLGSPAIVAEMYQMLYQSLPRDVASTLRPVVAEVMEGQSGGLMTFGILGALWSASSGLESLRLGLNRAYDAVENRPIVVRRLQAIAYVMGGAVLFIMAVVPVILGPVVLGIVREFVDVPFRTALTFNVLRYVAGAVALGTGLWAIHRFLPRHGAVRPPLWPGIGLTIAMWLVAASAFSLYLAYLGNFAVTYGSLGGVIALLLFFYLTSAIFVLGGEVNMTLARLDPELSVAMAPDVPYPGG